jgi:flagellin
MVSLDSLSGLSGTHSQNLQKANAKIQIAIAALATGERANRASDAIAELAIATQLQTRTSSLKQASGNLAQASSLAQVADGGAAQIQDTLQQLRDLATQANSPVLSDANRKQLNEQFQQLKSDIDRIASNTSFGEQELLNGDLTGDKSISLNGALGIESGGEGDQQLSIDSLSSNELFGGQGLNLLSAANASQAVNAIGDALKRATSVRANIGAFQQSVEFAAASVDSAVANQEAAQSILTDTDFAETSTGFSLANLQQNVDLAIIAQSNKLKPGLLQLIG